MIVIGRFAFGGWAIFTGTAVAVCLVVSLAQKSLSFDFLWIVFFSLVGGVGGATVGLIAAVLDRLIKPTAGKRPPVVEADTDAPGVWPPRSETAEITRRLGPHHRQHTVNKLAAELGI